MINVIFQMDPWETIHKESDSSYALIKESMRRGYDTYMYTPENLTYREGDIEAVVWKFVYKEGEICPTPHGQFSLKEANIIFIRQDPPFDMKYITSTYLLELLPNNVLVLNNPSALRNASEKIFPLQWHTFMPKTVITRDKNVYLQCLTQWGKAVIKPLYGKAGEGVFLMTTQDKNVITLWETLMENSPLPMIVQEFVEAITEGDKRIILVQGEILGAFLRIPQKNSIRSNLRAGGRAVLTEVTDTERKIVETITSQLIELDLFFVGLDMIGNYITEINVTSPTGLNFLAQLSGQDPAKEIWDHLEKNWAWIFP